MKCYQEYSSDSSWSTAKVTIAKGARMSSCSFSQSKSSSKPLTEKPRKCDSGRKAQPLPSFALYKGNLNI